MRGTGAYSPFFEARLRLVSTSLQHRQRADPLGQRFLRWFQTSLPVDVPPAELDWVKAKRLGQSRHHDLGGKLGLRRAKAAECTGRNIVRVYRVPVHRNIGHLITPAGEK